MFLAHERITVLSQIPSVFRNLVPFYEATPAMLPLRYVIFGGDRIDLPAVRRFRASYQSAVPAFVNMYGITETTVHATLKVLTEADIADDCSVIGRPLTSLEIEIVDERLHVVEDGSPGEILVAGDGVAAGYLGRPELTAERFVSVDLGRGTRRYYRSGDLGRRRDDGELEYLGRIDSQVKLRGFRIELGEIEAIAREVAGVRDAASTVLWREPGDGTLVLILVTAGDQPKSDLIEATRARFRADAPAHLAPHEIVISDSVPIAPSGKLDRQELPSLARRLTSR
jgi:acyl-CoA synthetase (AMP-forming)/AMP-acid ligase II